MASKIKSNCIYPESLFGAIPYEINFTGGFGGRPGTHTVSYVNKDGDYNASINNINLNQGMEVGITGFTRNQVLVQFDINNTVGGKVLTAHFEDKAFIDLQRHLIINRQLIQRGQRYTWMVGDHLSSSCVSVYGTLYHIAPGAPNRRDLDTVRLGPAPVIYQGGDAGNDYKKLGSEFTAYSASSIANDSKINHLLGAGLKNLLREQNNTKLLFLEMTGNALSVITTIAGKCGWFLFANNSGQLDGLSELPRIPKDAAKKVGSRCNVTAIKETVNIRNTFEQGAWATWKHDDFFLGEFTGTFLAIDLLGLPLPVCDPLNPKNEKPKTRKEAEDLEAEDKGNAGNGDGSDEVVEGTQNSQFVSMYQPNMTKEYVSQLKRLLKIAILDEIWQNWDGLPTYIHIKRLRESRANGVIKTFSPQALKDHMQEGGNAKNIRMDCQESAPLPVRSGDKEKITQNIPVNLLFPCVRPAVLNFGAFGNITEGQFVKALMNDGSNQNQEITVPPGGGRQILVLDAGFNVNCRGVKGGGSKPQPDKAVRPNFASEVGGGQWSSGSAADRAEMLSSLARTIGRFWALSGTGGGGGGGASLMTERQHNHRDYSLPHGRLYWYDKRLSVRNTVFAPIYEKIYGDRLKEWNLAGGIRRVGTPEEEADRAEVIAEGGEWEDDFDQVFDLSVTQFLHLASKLKFIALDKGNDVPELQAEEEEAFKHGNGMDNDEIAQENENNKLLCRGFEPKGIVIWDSDEKEYELPLANKWLSSMAGGVESKVEKTGNDVVRFSMQQATLGIIMNPVLHEKNHDPAEASDPDQVDFSLDNLILNQDLEWIGERRVKNLKFEAKVSRFFYQDYKDMPHCDSQVYKFQFAHTDMSGRILWRTLDCYGNIVDWRSRNDGYNPNYVNQVLGNTVREMVNEELDPDSSYTITTCGESSPVLPTVEGGLQSYTLSIAADGTVGTTFSLSREAIRGAQNYLANVAINHELIQGKLMNQDGVMTSASSENLETYNSFIASQKSSQMGTNFHLGTWYRGKGVME
ncbi:MAG: hypothetical protein EBY39_01875 [Flavobacteriia bacterium]|nr:hypothetical protein [Flavobacteriia bacterium]